MIIGITGTLGAGKGTVVDYFVKKGFKHHSVRQFLIKEINRRGMLINRDSMVYVANELRKNNSPSYIAEELYELAKKEGGNCIIESIRTPGEAEALTKKAEFYLIAVDADSKIRYTRILTRNNETDNVIYEEFVGNEKREMYSEDPSKQNLGKCIEMADFKIENNETIEELDKKIEEIYKQIEGKNFVRPSWDEYFMEIVKAVAKRATCDRGRTGCVIVKDKHILVTGYVGAPAGLSHCDEVGHQMKTMIHEDGTSSQHCVRTAHAEQNAICQAAKSGISLEGSTLYCKMTPCSVCAKMIINCGIKNVISEKDYHRSAESKEMFKQAGIKLEILNPDVETYKNM